MLVKGRKKEEYKKRKVVNTMAVKKNWEHLAGCDWAQLLQFQPRFSNKCDWSKLEGEDWAYLLARQPQFADMCDDECDFSQLTASDWSQVLVLRPDLVGKFESIERDWSKDDEIDDVEAILQGPL